MDIFGIPMQALFGQLLIGLINGAFYAMLSLGLAVIFGLLNIINFTHGAQYMMGAFCAWFLLEQGRRRLLVGAAARADRRRRDRRRDRAHDARAPLQARPPVGLLLTFGLALIIQGVFRNEFGSSGLPYRIPTELTGAYNLGFMFLPKYRAWVIVASLDRVPRHLVRDRAHQARRLPARGDRESGAGAGVRHQRAAHDHADLRLRRGARRARRRDGGADLPGEPADGRRTSSSSCSRSW